MFKVLLIVYVLGGGGSSNIDNTYNTNFIFQEFHSMADCHAAEAGMKSLLTWNRTKKGGKEDPVTALYSTKCIEMTATNQEYSLPSGYSEPDDPPIVSPKSNHRVHKRWNDK